MLCQISDIDYRSRMNALVQYICNSTMLMVLPDKSRDMNGLFVCMDFKAIKIKARCIPATKINDTIPRKCTKYKLPYLKFGIFTQIIFKVQVHEITTKNRIWMMN